LTNLLDSISTHFDNKLPFVIYRKPNDNTIFSFLMQETDLRFVSNFEEVGFVFAPFSSIEKAIIFPVERALIISEEWTADVYKEKEVVFNTDNTGKEEYLKIVEKAIEQIRLGHLKKVVISREELLKVPDFNLIEVYKKLLRTYKNAFVYAWFHPKVGLWLGATPETLLSIENTSFTTMSLAGTQLHTEHKKATWKSKELAEQQLVTTYIEKQLEQVATALEVDKTETVKAGNLLHLRTKVSGSLKHSASLKELIGVLHPTPAVCGLPREASRSFILKNEVYERRFYTGFLGELNVQHEKSSMPKTVLFVNLRCMKINDNYSASLFIGGGITEDSNAEKEWEETISKSKTMKCVL
tara:strand:- start:46027 stop:47091 length:1065 start_codon:yes stop_codon:yes gene_type:complete